MTLTTSDLSDRYTMLPNPLAVTHRSWTSGTTYANTSVSHAFKRPLSIKDILGLGLGAMGDESCVWLLPAALVGSAPKKNDIILDASNVSWYVKAVDRRLEETMHHCYCVREK